MLKFLLILFGLIAVSHAATTTKIIPMAIPALLQDMIPKETKTQLDELSSEQHMILEMAFRKYGANATAISAELEEKHPELAEKVSKTMGSFEKKIGELDKDGKDYIGKIIKHLQSIKTVKDLTKAARALINDWNDLSEKTKESVEKQFPSIPKVLASDKFSKIAQAD